MIVDSNTLLHHRICGQYIHFSTMYFPFQVFHFAKECCSACKRVRYDLSFKISVEKCTLFGSDVIHTMRMIYTHREELYTVVVVKE